MNNTAYKLSRYNVLFSWECKRYIWNTLSDALIELDPYDEDYLSNFSGEESHDDTFDTFLKNGCIVHGALDELGRVLADEKSVMLNTQPLCNSFTIAPGMNCNYNCLYCFENDHRSHSKMSPQTLEDVYSYITTTLKNNANAEQCHITWFGGEPLLYQDIIRELSTKLITFCDNAGIKFHAGIVTNGRLLTQSATDLLRECRVTQAQISVDGMEKTYMYKKQASSDDFYTVLDNIAYASDFIQINVRINCDHDTDVEEVFELADLLLRDKKLDDKISMYIGFVRDYTVSSEVEQGNHATFIKTQRQLEKYLKDHYNGRNYGQPVPSRRLSSCLQMCCANACIGPSGELYRCEHYFGNEEAVIGDVKHGRYFNDFDQKYYNFCHLDKCLQCTFFPTCLGGCLDDHVNGRNAIACESYCQHLIEQKISEISSKSIKKGGD